MSASGKLLVVAGSTATGKTDAAVALAERFDGEVVSADSVQVYRGFDIGSAKPTAEETRGIPHHLLDVLNPDETMDAMDFARLADQAIASIQARDRLPIVVGGTGLWMRALVRGLVALPPVDPALRERLLEEGERLGRPALHARLQAVDPKAAAAIHPNDLVRISRALEVFEQTGKALGELREAHALGENRYETLFIVLERGADHDARIEARLDRMIDRGWREETESLLREWPKTARPFGSVGYQQIVDHLCEGVPWDETRARIRKATRIYGRRQRTWFGGEPGIDWRLAREDLLTPAGLARVAGFRR